MAAFALGVIVGGSGGLAVAAGVAQLYRFAYRTELDTARRDAATLSRSVGEAIAAAGLYRDQRDFAVTCFDVATRDPGMARTLVEIHQQPEVER